MDIKLLGFYSTCPNRCLILRYIHSVWFYATRILIIKKFNPIQFVYVDGSDRVSA
jgi:hypothetical protein